VVRVLGPAVTDQPGRRGIDAGLRDAAAGFGLSAAEIVAAVRAAPSMRPDRHTVLNEPHVGEEAIGEAVADVLAPVVA
jgi:hypothetical protein